MHISSAKTRTKKMTMKKQTAKQNEKRLNKIHEVKCKKNATPTNKNIISSRITDVCERFFFFIFQKVPL